ncbi:hypothetical protein, partial [Adhaeribacter aerolatus]|uniref:hypothetical protein n=1 Tax=Adhaeribacter aerolatus TaxID=670289 RepID=UPI001C3F5CE6
LINTTMKKQILLGMVTLLVAIPGFSQIKADEDNAIGPNAVPFLPSNLSQLPYMNFHGFQLQPKLYQPKGFQGVLIPKQKTEKPNWLKPENIKNSMPRMKPPANQKMRVARPDSTIRYH